MKTSLIAGTLGAGIFLSGCGTTVVDRRNGHGSHGYYDDGRQGYSDTRYRYGDNGTQYHTRNVERTNVYETNVYETNVRRNVTNRNNVSQTVVKIQSQRGQSTVNGQASSGVQTHTASKVHQQSSKKIKAKGNDQKGDDKEKKHEGDVQAPQ